MFHRGTWTNRLDTWRVKISLHILTMCHLATPYDVIKQQTNKGVKSNYSLETIEKWDRDKGVDRLVFENLTFSLTFSYKFERSYLSK